MRLFIFITTVVPTYPQFRVRLSALSRKIYQCVPKEAYFDSKNNCLVILSTSLECNEQLIGAVQHGETIPEELCVRLINNAEAYEEELLRRFIKTQDKKAKKPNELQKINERINRLADEEFDREKKKLKAFYQEVRRCFSEKTEKTQEQSKENQLFEEDSYDKDSLMKSWSGNISPTVALFRSPELEYIRYRKKHPAKNMNYDILDQKIPAVVLGSWPSLPVLQIVDADKHNIYLPVAVKKNDENGPFQPTEVVLQKKVLSPAIESTIQLLRQSGVIKNDSRNDSRFGEDRKLNAGSGEKSSTNGTFQDLNVTEVYEEPFIRVYVKPLCEGFIC
uniref:Uncharacterized protein n=1 Tax=Setaria digitata TaxID=48799 RepID=A0A915PWL4_9BILA